MGVGWSIEDVKKKKEEKKGKFNSWRQKNEIKCVEINVCNWRETEWKSVNQSKYKEQRKRKRASTEIKQMAVWVELHEVKREKLRQGRKEGHHP